MGGGCVGRYTECVLAGSRKGGAAAVVVKPSGQNRESLLCCWLLLFVHGGCMGERRKCDTKRLRTANSLYMRRKGSNGLQPQQHKKKQQRIGRCKFDPASMCRFYPNTTNQTALSANDGKRQSDKFCTRWATNPKSRHPDNTRLRYRPHVF